MKYLTTGKIFEFHALYFSKTAHYFSKFKYNSAQESRFGPDKLLLFLSVWWSFVKYDTQQHLHLGDRGYHYKAKDLKLLCQNFSPTSPSLEVTKRIRNFPHSCLCFQLCLTAGDNEFKLMLYKMCLLLGFGVPNPKLFSKRKINRWLKFPDPFARDT